MSVPIQVVLRNCIHKLSHYSELIRFEHSIFALPFALSALLLAVKTPGWPTWSMWGWVILAMVGGRTYAMALNRIADASIDAKNPRTAQRGIPSGRVTLLEAWTLALLGLGAFAFATWQLPLICQLLWPVAVMLLTLYSWMKRFSALCHLVLGLCLGAGAVGGWLAAGGHWHGGIPLALGLGIACWVMGFDVIYACQDTRFDQQEGLWSIPARLGIAQALRFSRYAHIACMLCLIGFGSWYHTHYQPMVVGYWVALVLMGILLWKEHQLVRPDDLSRVNEAFFTLNGWISLGMFTCLLLSKLVQR
ncbi:MAG: UbiA-like polyprenyltransferase [Vampirovibrionales bacterium]